MISWRRFFSGWQNWIGLAMVLAFAAVAVAAPVISPPDERQPGAFKVVGRPTDNVPHPPGTDPKAILGTLPGQLDVFHTLVWGCRDAMQFGLLAALGAASIGVLIGAISGYAGGAVDALLMRVADAFLAFPPLAGAVFLQQLAAISITALGGVYFFNPSMQKSVLYFEGPLPPLALFLETIDPLLISLILFSWMPYARVVNALVLALKQSEFVLAARALGAGSFWIVRRHLLPNSISPAIVLAARDVGSAVVLQATLVAIGLSVNSPWGSLLAIGRNWITGGPLTFWWVYLPATVVMVVFGSTWNWLGDGLNAALLPGSLGGAESPQAKAGESSTRERGVTRASRRRQAGPRAGTPRLLGMRLPEIAILAAFVALECLVLFGFVLLISIKR